MSFSWTQDISIGASIDAADMNEVKTNIDSIYTYLSITRTGCGSGAGWTELPVSAGSPIENVDLAQLRAAIDYAYDNKCQSAYGTYNSGADGGYESGVLTGQDSGAVSGVNSGADSGEDSGANPTNNGVCAPFYGST